ncbi:MAG: GNAT family N-acetyltransferase [Firmicutes bacterium]|jgi:ribosomal-protein-alanine N-acetyltransferase|nr:GNAT family N-acetyltransferase [Bacillota bacterium]
MSVCFETERLIMRRWREEDLAPFIEMNQDPKVCQYFRNTISPESSVKFYYNTVVPQFAKYGWGLYAVEVKETSEFIGFNGFHWLDIKADFAPCIEIGWRLKSDAWGFGYATEGAKAALKHGFEVHNIEEVFSNTSALNVPSENVMKRIGLKHIGFFDYPGFAEDEPLRNHVLYHMDRELYAAKKQEGFF